MLKLCILRFQSKDGIREVQAEICQAAELAIARSRIALSREEDAVL